MGKKSGKACKAVDPAEPDQAEDADIADPGKMAEIKAEQEEKKDESRVAAIPLRFQAYERIMLFLERISPQNMVLR